jgi:hypothetical protein
MVSSWLEHQKGAFHQLQPPPISCHMGRAAAMVSGQPEWTRGATSDHLGHADQWDCGQSAYPPR